MHSTLLFLSLLAFVHFISATPARRDISGASFVPNVHVSGGPVYARAGCHKVGALTYEQPLEDKITVELCVSKCFSGGNTQGGVANTQCFCEKVSNGGGTPVSDDECKKSTCAGNSNEYCGSDSSLILYQRSAN